MPLADLRQLVLQSMAASLSSRGFRLSEQSLWRPRDSVRQFIHVSFINHATDFDYTIDVAVRHDEVERRWGTQQNLPAREKRQTATVGVELGNWADGRAKRWTVACREDADTTLHDALAWMGRFGMPFLERFSSLEETLRTLESDTREGRLICPIASKRESVISIAKAILAERAA